jgi:hypothetical protein
MANAAAVQILTSIGMPEKDARKQLENNTLDLSLYGNGYERCVTDIIVIGLARLCPGVTKVDLRDCYAVTDASIMALAWRYPGLTSIDLSNCDITDDALLALSENCPELTTIHLDFDETSTVTDAGIIALAENCPGLSYIASTGIIDLTDDAIIAIAENCPGLTRLSLSASDITDAATTAVAVNCPGLTRINLHSCGNITDTTIIALWKNCERLKYIDWDEDDCHTGITKFGAQLAFDIMKRAQDLVVGTGRTTV